MRAVSDWLLLFCSCRELLSAVVTPDNLLFFPQSEAKYSMFCRSAHFPWSGEQRIVTWSFLLVLSCAFGVHIKEVRVLVPGTLLVGAMRPPSEEVIPWSQDNLATLLSEETATHW